MEKDILSIAENIQEHGDLAFIQGYHAALQNIDINDRKILAKMPEAQERYMQFANAVGAIEEAKEKWLKKGIKPVNGKMSYVRTK